MILCYLLPAQRKGKIVTGMFTIGYKGVKYAGELTDVSTFGRYFKR